MAAQVYCNFLQEFEGSRCSPGSSTSLRRGDVVEAYVVSGEDVAPPALLVIAQAFDDHFTAHLVAAAEKEFTKELIELGDPLVVFLADTAEQSGFVDGAVGLGVVKVLGNTQYPVELRVPWLRGASLKKARGLLDKISAKLLAEAVASPPRFLVSRSCFSFLTRFGSLT